MQPAPKAADFPEDRFLGPVQAHQAQFALVGVPVIGRLVKMQLIVSAPPEQALTVMRPEGEQGAAGKIGGDGFAGNQRPEGANFLGQAGLTAQIRVKPAFGRGMQNGAEGIDRVLVAMGRENGVGMGGEQIGQFTLILHRPTGFALGEQAVHPRDNRPGLIFGADGVGDGPGGLARGDGCHAVAFVAQIPGDNGRMGGKPAHKAAHQAGFPLDGERVGENVAAFEGGGNKQAAAHPAGEQPHDQFQVVFLRQVGQDFKPRQHFAGDTGLTGLVVGQGLFAEAEFHRFTGPGAQQGKGLKIGPERENPQHLNPGRC